MMRYLIIILFAALCFGETLAQTKDSLKIVSLFSEALTHPESKTDLINQARSIQSRYKGNKEMEAIYLLNYSKYLMFAGKLDSSLSISNKGLSLFPKEEDFGRVKFLNLIASVKSLQQDNKNAIELFKKSLALCDLNKQPLQAAYIKNNIANLFISMLDYKSAYQYVKEAYDVLKDYPDDPYLSSITSVLSVTELKLEKLNEAKKHGLEALSLAEKQANVSALIISNYTLGEIELGANSLTKSEVYFQKSIELSTKYNQQHYVLLNNIGLMNLNIEKKNFDSAIEFGERALELAIDRQNKNIEYSIKKHLAYAYAGISDYKKAYDLMESSHSIFLANNDRETQNSINDILVKYDTEKKEKEIAKNKLLLLEKEVESSRLINLITLLVFALLLVVFLLLGVRSRNKQRVRRLHNEKERDVLNAIIEGEEIERERLASELHDGLASILTAAKYKVEALDTNNDRNELIKVLSNAQIETRRIAHNLTPINLLKLGLTGALEYFAKENSSEELLINFNSNTSNLELKKEQNLLIYRVAQELVQNALKYANATQIDVQLMKDENELRLTVEDDGKGFDPSSTAFNGLLTIQHRAAKVNGYFEINSSTDIGTGTVALFSLPLITSN